MRKFWCIFAVFFVCFVQQYTAQNDLTPEEQQELFKEGENKMSKHILEIIEHYKQEDPIGVPGVPIPEPLDIPPLRQSLPVGTMNFKNVKLYGLSKFRIDHIASDLAAMQVKAGLRIKTLDVYGNYTLSSWISKYQGPFTVKLSNVYVEGVDVGTQKLEGKSHWEIAVGGGMISRAGTLSFTIDYFNVQIVLSQTLDTRNHPVLEDIQLEMGNIQVRCNGAGTVDYLIEFGVNVFPNLLRYQIMDAIESPIKKYIQDQLNRVNVEEIIKEKLPELEAAKDGFKF
ncbi:uncharacterized protein CBL_13762 [Carabus blaptoides fortunei]